MKNEYKLECMFLEHVSTRQGPEEKKRIFTEKDMGEKKYKYLHHTFAYVLSITEETVENTVKEHCYSEQSTQNLCF